MSEIRLRVLRHVPGLSEAAVAHLTGKRGGTEPRVPGFPEWLDADHPRDAWLTEEIMAQTSKKEGFAVADDARVYGKFDTNAEAEKVRQGGLTLKVEPVLPAADPEPEAAPAPAASK